MMLKWIGRAFGGNTKAAGRKQLNATPDNWLKQLSALLAAGLRKGGSHIRPNLIEDILAYVEHGQPDSILVEVAQTGKIGECLQMTGYFQDPVLDEITSKLYRDAASLPPAELLRWLFVLEASVGAEAEMFSVRMPDHSHWQETLLMHASSTSITCLSRRREINPGITSSLIETLLIEAGLRPDTFLVACFATPFDEYSSAAFRLSMVTDLSDYSAALERYSDTLRPYLVPDSDAQQQHVIALLEKAETETLAKFIPELCQLAVFGHGNAREALNPLLERCGPEVIATMKQNAVSGSTEHRIGTLRWLWSVAQDHKDDALKNYARQVAQNDDEPWVQALVEEWSGESRSGASAWKTPTDAIPPPLEVRIPLGAIPSNTAVSQDTSLNTSPNIDIPESFLDPFWHHISENVERQNRPLQDDLERQALEEDGKSDIKAFPAYPDSARQQLQECLATHTVPPQPEPSLSHFENWKFIPPALPALIELKETTPEVIFRTLQFFGLLINGEGHLSRIAVDTFNAVHRIHGAPTLTNLAALLETVDIQPKTLLLSCCDRWQPLAEEWDVEAVSDFFTEQIDAIATLLASTPTEYPDFDRQRLFRILALLPGRAPDIMNRVFELALTCDSEDRAAAEVVFENFPDKEARITAALSDTNPALRAAAADWLGHLHHLSAITILETALRTEKDDMAQTSIFDALIALGQPVEKYLDRPRLESEAGRLAKKRPPKDLRWFPWEDLPEVHWTDTTHPVPADILRWLLVSACKRKSPQPTGRLRKLCSLFEREDREYLGQFVLTAWIDHDTQETPTEAVQMQASAKAEAAMETMEAAPGITRAAQLEELTAQFLSEILQQSPGTAFRSRGVLAVTAACAGLASISTTERYLEKYQALRPAQCRVLIAMLAGVDLPRATGLMLSAGNRFRSKALQNEVARQTQEMARRKRWSAAELADRTIPAAGFEKEGVLELTYGKRMFQARLSSALEVELFDEEDQKIPVLPRSLKGDDAALVKAAKKTLFSAKKSVGDIVEAETERLHEALCIEREWSLEVWNHYFNQHPIVSHLVRRLIWMQVESGAAVRSFRPSETGDIIDVDGNPVILPLDARIRLAHDSFMLASEVRAWQRHLDEHHIQPLFRQIGKEGYALPESKRKDLRIQDFEGYLIAIPRLRELMEKYGYTRCPAETNGWFYAYEKHFPALGLTVMQEFSGCSPQEKNRSVAMLSLSFLARGSGTRSQSRVPLAKIPKLLLAECYSDLRTVATEGSGYDHNWKRKMHVEVNPARW